MWLGIAIIPLILLGIVATVVGLGPLGPFLIAGGVVLFVLYLVRQSAAGRPDREPESVPGGHKATGHAHDGQQHMTPDSL